MTRDLLREAWPSGLLTMRGLTTVGSWTCAAVAEEEALWTWGRVVPKGKHAGKMLQYDAGSIVTGLDGTLKGPSYAALRWARDFEEGGLLPNVDPEDTATWACLLRDLAQASNVLEARKATPGTHLWPIFTNVGLFFHPGVHHNGYWHLTAPTSVRTWQLVHEGKLFTEDNPALALILARIDLRRQGA